MSNSNIWDREEAVKPMGLHGFHHMQGTAHTQRGITSDFQENKWPPCENSGAGPSSYTPFPAHGLGLPIRCATTDIDAWEAPIYQKDPVSVFGHSYIDYSDVVPPNALQQPLSPIENETRSQYGSWGGNKGPPQTSANPNYPLNFTSKYVCFEPSQHPVTSDSAMPSNGSLHPSWQHHGNILSFSQNSHSMSSVGFGHDFQHSQGPQRSSMYHQSPSSAAHDATPAKEQADPTIGSKSSTQRRKKLCNNYHLRGACLVGNSCHYVHGVISQVELRELRRIAKGVVCKFGLNCTDDLCYAGHKCPYESGLGHSCHFPDEMHYDGPEETRGRIETVVTHGIENQQPHSLFNYELNGPTSQPPPTYEEEDLKVSHIHQIRHTEQSSPVFTLQHTANIDEIQRQVDELVEGMAPLKKSHTVSPVTHMRSAREVTDLDLDLFQETLAKSLHGSQAASSPYRQPSSSKGGPIISSQPLQFNLPRPTPPSSRTIPVSKSDPPHNNMLKRPLDNQESNLKETPHHRRSPSSHARTVERRRRRLLAEEERRGGPLASAREYNLRRERENARRRERVTALQLERENADRQTRENAAQRQRAQARHVRDSSPHRVDFWRPHYHPKGDYYRPGHERRDLYR